MLSFMRKNAAKIVIATVLFFVLSIVLAYLPSVFGRRSSRQQKSRAAGKIALVNGEEINHFKFNQEIQKIIYSIVEDPKEDKLGSWEILQAQYQALQRAMEHELILKDARAHKVKVSRKEINAQLKKITQQYNLKNVKQLKAEFKKRNVSFNDLKQLVKEEIMISKRRQQVVRVLITERTLNDMYKSVEARHILLKLEPQEFGTKKEKQIKSQLERWYQELLASPNNFAEYAQKYSEDTDTAKNGGYLGYFEQGKNVEEFERMAFALGKGEISLPVKTAYGYHLIKVENIRDPGVPLDVDLTELKDRVKNEKQTRAFQKWYLNLYKETTIEISQPLLEAMDLLMKGNADKALIYFKRIQANIANYLEGHLLLGRAYAYAGEFKEALAEYKKAQIKQKILKKENFYLPLYMSMTYYQLNNKGRARQLLLEVENNLGQNIPLALLLKQEYARQNLPSAVKRIEQNIDQIREQRKVEWDKLLQQIQGGAVTQNESISPTP